MEYLTVRVPGKLMVAGEYAVLEPGRKAVVAAVDRYITASIQPSVQNLLSIPGLGLEDARWAVRNGNVEFEAQDPRLGFIQNSILVACQYLKEESIPLLPFKLRIESGLNDPITGRKYGLGSSAAVVTAVISSVMGLHFRKIDFPGPDTIFKLSAIAHLKTQKSGSGADVAAAVFGGWLEYSAFRSEWILNELEQGKMTDMLAKPWPHLSIRFLLPPPGLQLAVGWTKEAASTESMIEKVLKFRQDNPEAYNEFLRESSAAVAMLTLSFETGDCLGAIKSLSQNRKTLQKLGRNAGINIETEKLKTLCDTAERFGSGKPSGAGGGDCGIAFLNSSANMQRLYQSWEEADISPLDLRVQ